MLELSKEEIETVQKVADSILNEFENTPENLIPILQNLQDRLQYVPGPAMEKVAESLDIPEVDVFEVVTFYNQFRLYPPGENQFKVCMGTACYMVGGEIALDSFERRLDIKEGETTEDRKYGLERVACVGCCSMAPVVVVNDKIEGHVTPTRVDGLLFSHDEDKKENNTDEKSDDKPKEGEEK
ncbi:complex I 24 kDa subunit family protein [Natranaerofaba carboxydovora]|uniref:NADH-quinone oxidoreductase subunit NuoE family protein n=1 Tax=Natranaerofaba carboxydovora TaxID=2742683 RepID=UPI001F12E955|nr:NAD(P)H-dependent oxidoreductase subunit E [Natranaerofaba carboxydovora]UMZ74142.1 NADP-reducing hydrogenase subunit HndA [Natranaerofaba carboxydovora]